MKIRPNTATTQNPPSGPENPQAGNSTERWKSSPCTLGCEVSLRKGPSVHTPILDSWSQGALWTTVRVGLNPAQLSPFCCGLPPQGSLAGFWAVGYRVSKFC